MKIRKGRQSGTLGGEVSVDSKYGQVVRSRPRRPWHDTEARARARYSWTDNARLWRKLSDKQRAGWTALGQQTPCKSGDESGARLHGCQLLMKINCALAGAGLPPMKDAPKRVKLGPNPVKGLRIRNRQGKTTLELELDRACAGYLVVLGSRPCSAGISVRNAYSTIAVLPAPRRGAKDITADYVKRFGVPPVGWRVFIRTRQLLDGWAGEFKDTSAVVPGEQVRRGGPEGRA